MDLKLIAVDVGASSGRTIAGRFDKGLLKTEEVCRFSHK